MLSAELLRLLDAMARGAQPSAVQLTLLSDLGSEDAAELAAAWLRIPGELREQVVERAAALAEDNVDLDFSALVNVALADPVAAVRRSAVEAAWESRSRQTARLLRNLLESDDDESVRAAAATAMQPYVLATELGEFDPAEGARVVETLKTAWGRSDESLDVRARALESLGALSAPWVTTLINDAYYDGDRRMRVAAVRAMGESASEAWLEYLEETAASDDPELRYETAVALATIGSEAATDVLADLLRDDDPEVVAAAVAGLGQVGGDDAVRHLLDLQPTAEGMLAEAIEEALEAARYADAAPLDLLRSRIGL
jgi:HEAT repeat protein